MKKNLTVLLAALLIGGTAFGQAISDRNVIPVAVNLNQVLRMTITNGGNIEFVFSTIDHYKNGISGATATTGEMYVTEFTVASSTSWELNYGAERATFIGTDDPAHTLDLDNVGFTLVSGGAHTIGAVAGTGELACIPTGGVAATIADLDQYPVALLSDNGVITASNAGDETDNSFTMTWRCGTAEGGMNTIRLIEEAITPDRYVANVLFELSSL